MDGPAIVLKCLRLKQHSENEWITLFRNVLDRTIIGGFDAVLNWLLPRENFKMPEFTERSKNKDCYST